MERFMENEAVEVGGILVLVASFFGWLAEVLTPANINDWAQILLAILSVIFIITRISLNIHKKRGQKIRNKLDQKELDEKSKGGT
jgi:thiosulfate reductase cytochrome b subunit